MDNHGASQLAVDEVGGLALTYGNAQSEGNAFPRMLAVAGAALDIDMDTPHTNEAYTDEDDNGATPHGNAGARHPNRAGNEKRDRDQAPRRLSRDDHASGRDGRSAVAAGEAPGLQTLRPASARAFVRSSRGETVNPGATGPPIVRGGRGSHVDHDLARQSCTINGFDSSSCASMRRAASRSGVVKPGCRLRI
eukprot:jgi/Tetstr1/440140/TSEL_028497.t1